MNYYEHNAKATSWEVVPFPAIEVTERRLTDKEAEQFRQQVEKRYANRTIRHVGDDAGVIHGRRGVWGHPG